MDEQYIIYLKCYEGSGYYTGIGMTSTGKEVRLHTSKFRAAKFSDQHTAMKTAMQLKSMFRCIISFDIRQY